MLARLENALGRTDLTKQMILLPQSFAATTQASEETNLVVGYNGSPHSQTALDLTLWIAHQTRLATSKQITVQVVYVVNWADECQLDHVSSQTVAKPMSGKSAYSRKKALSSSRSARSNRSSGTRHSSSSSAIAERPTLEALSQSVSQSCQFMQFEEADRILWQARHLADEWRGSLKTHLRFGQVAQELRHVVEAESAALLLLGCESVKAPIVQELGPDFPCPVLGIPTPFTALEGESSDD